MADVITGALSELDSTKAVLIAKMVQKELAFKPVLVKTISDVTPFALPGQKQISFPKLTSFTVTNRAEGAYGDASALTSSVDTMSLNFNAYVSWIIDSYSATQSSIDAQLENAKLAAAAQSRYVDEQIIVKMAAVAASFQNVGVDVDVTYSNLLAMRKAILKADGDLSMCSIAASPAQEAVLLGLTEFKQADYYGGPATIPSGMIGSILGMPVFVHNGLADKQLFMFEKTGLAVGFQKNAQYGEESAIGYGVGAKKAAIDQLFGLMGLQLGLKGAAAGKSPLVIGLND